MQDIAVIKQKNANIGAWIETWRKRYERNYDLSNSTDQDEFYEGVIELAKHIIHSSNCTSMKTVLNADGITTLYINPIPKAL